MYQTLDIFWNIWNLILWRESGNKRSSCSEDYNSSAFIPGKSEQKFKINPHIGIFDPVIEDGQWYY